MRKELCMHVKNSQEKNAATRETSDKRRGTDRRKKERKEMISLSHLVMENMFLKVDGW
jgi:hypothetical protein